MGDAMGRKEGRKGVECMRSVATGKGLGNLFIAG